MLIIVQSKVGGVIRFGGSSRTGRPKSRKQGQEPSTEASLSHQLKVAKGSRVYTFSNTDAHQSCEKPKLAFIPLRLQNELTANTKLNQHKLLNALSTKFKWFNKSLDAKTHYKGKSFSKGASVLPVWAPVLDGVKQNTPDSKGVHGSLAQLRRAPGYGVLVLSYLDVSGH